MATEADVRRIAMALPEVTEGEGRLGFAVADKGFVWSWMERVVPKQPKVERRDVLAVRVAGADDKQAMLTSDPEVYFTEPHYNGYPAVLVRLEAIELDELEDILLDAWRRCAPKALVKAFDAANL
ncbi:MAG: hypothetical protein ABJA67_03620 [Chthonomonadales bacterium]